MTRIVLWMTLWLLALSDVARAEMFVAAGQSLLRAPAGALIQARAGIADTARTSVGSLFAGNAQHGLFAPMPARELLVSQTHAPLTGSPIERLRQLIQHAESRRDGYDAVQHGATIKPPGRPTDLSVAQIFEWIDATPGQPHAIGRYQFIPTTLRSLVRRLGLTGQERFTPGMQDRLADLLLIDAGLHATASGVMKRDMFMDNLAKIWAGLPTSTGLSHYDGFAGNKASISRAMYETEMARIFPG